MESLWERLLKPLAAGSCTASSAEVYGKLLPGCLQEAILEAQSA